MPLYSGKVPGKIEKSLRLDRYVSEQLGLLSRSQLKTRLISARVNGKNVKLSRLLNASDTLEIEWKEMEPTELEAENIFLEVLYEDARVVVVNKAQGLVVHPGAGNRSGTLANALLFRKRERGLDGAGLRPGIVHRLDKDTSGLIICAYDDKALTYLADQFKARTVKKNYIALVRGWPPSEEGTIETLIGRDPRNRKTFTTVESGGKLAISSYKVLRYFEGYALVLLGLKTGRTHQLRVHMKHIKCPILGDPLYSNPDPKFPSASLMLHARRLKILLPDSNEPSTFVSPLPERFKRIMKVLKILPR